MSFILDALRKSEHERERKTLPGIVDVHVAKPDRQKVPVVLIGLGALLAVNLVVLLVVLLRSGTPAPAAAPTATTGAAPTTAAAPATAAPAAAPPPGYAPPAGVATSAPPPGAPATPLAGVASAPAAREVRPLDAEASGAATDENAPAYVEPPPVRRDPTLDGGARVMRAPSVYTADGPLDGIQPGPVPRIPPSGAAPSRASRAAAAEGVPSINDLSPQATAGLPPLGVSLHVYGPSPAERWVVINGRRYVEGATLQEGPTLEKIVPDGVVLDWRGLRFLVPRQ